MADTSSYRVPAGSSIADDDPFAELTRIMGFDPREKVTPRAPAEPDFGIDLERELMGDFATDQDNAPAATSAPQHPVPVEQPQRTAAEQPQWTAPFVAAPEPELSALEEELAEPADFAPSGREPEEAADPFADFDLAFRQEEAATQQTLQEEPVAAVAPVVEPDPIDESDDDVERAFAALEAWEHGRPIRRGASVVPVIDERQIAGMGATAGSAAAAPVAFEPEQPAVEDAQPDVWAEQEPEPDLDFTPEAVLAPEQGSPTEDEAYAASFDERDRFTAEEGWTDDATISLDEPQVLEEAGTAMPAQAAEAESEAEVDDNVDFDVASAGAPQAAPSFDDDFEQQLYDLLGGAESPESASAQADEEDWFNEVELVEGPAEADAVQAKPEAFEAADQWQPGPESDPVAEAEPPAAPEPLFPTPAQVATGVAVAHAWQAQPTQAYDVQSSGAPIHFAPAGNEAPPSSAEPQAAFRPEPVAQDAPEFHDLDLLDLSFEDLRDDEPARAGDAETPIAAAAEVATPNEPDPTDPTAATFDTEPDAMQPFNERAFDAALAEELALASDDDRQWRSSQHDDPFAFSPGSQSQAANYAPRQRPVVNAPAMHADVPDIETVDFVDNRLAHSDELDLPEVDYGHQQQPAGQFDDFDAEFASAFNTLNEEAPAPAQAQPGEAQRQPSGQTWDDNNFDWGVAAGTGAGVAAASASNLSRAGLYEPQEEDAYYEEQAYRAAHSAKPAPRRRGLLIGGAVAALVLIGGVVFIAMPGSPIGSGEPAVLRADSDPLKIRPENPGGTTVPNQNNVAYDRVGTSEPLATPTQERLITSAEEPVDLAAGEEDESPMAGLSALDGEGEMVGSEDEDALAKADDRLTPDQADGGSDIPQEMVALAPRKVRTMMVRSDGTLVPRDEAVAEPQDVASAAEAAIEPEPTAVAPTPAARLPEPAPATMPAPVAQQPAPVTQPTPVAEAPAPQVAAVQPAAVPAASDTPQVVEAAAAPAGWSVQIASQPSEAGAQSTYRDLARRYSSVLNGRSVNIVKAEVAGKGTYYRLRIPASSRSEANTICASYKSAGGNCFVSQ